MINYYCPEFFRGKKIYKKIIEYKRLYPEIFNEDSNIKFIFGSFPNMIWNGGSINIDKPIFLSEVMEIKEFYEELNIPIQLTLTNFSLKEEHLEDSYCNRILEIMDNGKNEVLISTELMYNYIKKYYPNYKINKSIVNSDNYNSFQDDLLNNKYTNIVLPRRYIKDIEFLSGIYTSIRNRIEILCNDPCPYNCKYMKKHYENFNKIALDGLKNVKDAFECTNPVILNSPFSKDMNSQIQFNDIKNIYNSMNYTEFKIAGRGKISGTISSLTQYLIKQEYQISFLEVLIKEVFY